MWVKTTSPTPFIYLKSNDRLRISCSLITDFLFVIFPLQNFRWLEELRKNLISSIPAAAVTHAVDLKDPTLPLPDSISAFMTHDINQRFPSQGVASKKLKGHEEQNQIGVHGSYDFVHSRLLVAGIDADQWVNVIKNMAELLSEWWSTGCNLSCNQNLLEMMALQELVWSLNSPCAPPIETFRTRRYSSTHRSQLNRMSTSNILFCFTGSSFVEIERYFGVSGESFQQKFRHWWSIAISLDWSWFEER